MAQTTAEFLIEQGMQLGIEQGKTEGKAEGKAEGKVEGKQDAALKLLELRFQNVPETLSREISNIHNHIASGYSLRTSNDSTKFRRDRYAFLLKVSLKGGKIPKQTQIANSDLRS